MRNSVTQWLLIVCFLAVGQAASEAWQSYGNFTPGNITFLLEKIDIADRSFSYPDYIVNNISDELNAAWDPAWNVVVVLNAFDPAYPIVNDFRNIFYGYAFRSHWFWYNNYYKYTKYGSDVFYSFIIWKDYKCKTWTTIMNYADGLDSVMNTTITDSNNAIITNNPAYIDDPWRFGYEAVTAAEKSYPTNSFAIIVMPNANSFYGRVCLPVNTNSFAKALASEVKVATPEAKLKYVILMIS